MRLSRQFQGSLFFLQKDFEPKKSTKTQNKRFPTLWAQKAIVFVVFCPLIFAVVGWFWLICVFVRSESFRKKKEKKN